MGGGWFRGGIVQTWEGWLGEEFLNAWLRQRLEDSHVICKRGTWNLQDSEKHQDQWLRIKGRKHTRNRSDIRTLSETRRDRRTGRFLTCNVSACCNHTGKLLPKSALSGWTRPSLKDKGERDHLMQRRH